MIRRVPVMLLALLMACCGGPTAPDTPPDLRGEHTGWWSLRERLAADPPGFASSISCWATIEITEQTGERVAGRYETDPDCIGSSGTLEGSVNINGWLEFTVTTAEGSLDPLQADRRPNCRLLGHDPAYAGSVIGGFLVRRTFTLRCGESAVFATSSFREILPVLGPRR